MTWWLAFILRGIGHCEAILDSMCSWFQPRFLSRIFWVKEEQAMHMTVSNADWASVSNKSGITTTHTLWPVSFNWHTSWLHCCLIIGCINWFNHFMEAPSVNMSEASFPRSRDPSAEKKEAPKCSFTAAQAACSGSRSCRAMISVSMSGSACWMNNSLTKDFPAPIPPVRPIKIMSEKKKGPLKRSLVNSS